MSADNAIAIAHFPKEDGSEEWRVAHVQAIENCDDSDMEPDGTMKYWPEEFIDANRVLYYGGAKPFNNEKDALEEASRLYNEEIDGGGIVEYGVSSINYTRPLKNWTKDEAIRIIDAFLGD